MIPSERHDTTRLVADFFYNFPVGFLRVCLQRLRHCGNVMERLRKMWST